MIEFHFMMLLKYGATVEGSLTVYDLGGVELDDKFRYPVKPLKKMEILMILRFRKVLEGKFGLETQRKILLV